MKKKLVFLLFLALICIGIEYETKTYTLGELSGKAYGIIGLAALLALLYIVPANLIILHFQKKWKTPLASLPTLISMTVFLLYLFLLLVI